MPGFSGKHVLAQHEFAGPAARHLAAKQDMRTVLDQRDKTDPWESGFAMTGAGSTKGRVVVRLIGDIQRAAIKAHEWQL